ncbi:hypothetical protein Goari_008989 [Gossypium aridum]|uniref:TOD1/MUCI70 glycosyltransferase-like domain-containing protein n=1 Tax=Gossypium aridum TaxID=34290 RepID=A0A7J8XWC2_GOSAI|nr:hypothetical protein [Gossypium aridum]
MAVSADVPEGCAIIREHVPIGNLFTCLWFNEIDRFTSRDQLSFSTVRDRVAAKTNWTVNMFLDCERRNFVVQKHHKGVLAMLAQMAPPAISPPPPPLSLANNPPRKSSLEIASVSPKHRRDWRNLSFKVRDFVGRKGNWKRVRDYQFRDSCKVSNVTIDKLK